MVPPCSSLDTKSQTSPVVVALKIFVRNPGSGRWSSCYIEDFAYRVDGGRSWGGAEKDNRSSWERLTRWRGSRLQYEPAWGAGAK